MTPVLSDRPRENDPALWCMGIAAAFFLIVLHRVGIPSKMMFDEIHYLPAARRLIDLTARLNPEHPLLAKQLIAWSMQLVGDTPFGWRLPSALLGAVGLWGMMRALWWASLSRTATVLFGLLLATDFIWVMMSRIALLDMAMGGFMALAVWQWALAWRNPSGKVSRARLHLMLTGAFMGLSLGAKWNGALLLPLPGLLFALNRWEALKGRRAGLLWSATGAGPVPGVSLIEAALWLGALPLLVYFATFLPAFFYEKDPLTVGRLIEWQQYMLQLQDSVKKPHTYMSVWWQWMANIRPIWFLYENVDGAQRGVLMLGNPFTMLAGLPALLFCGWDGLKGKRLHLLVFAAYALLVGFWAINGKPVQFYYHYMLASCFLIAALALVLAEWWDLGLRWPAKATLVLAFGLFIGFYPILSAGELPRKDSFRDYTWLDSWK
ncbi:phospholipid carrier-dependent glycosyltransferase [Novosphingobium sp. ERN07]|uniref:phospholipid carrier-dependent glycosyltransferase n=1 Tax=Novosphingobium sp. ERN07 TaxID=2726187 RepID=UPI0014577D62|nr:phospholipid carrier-dependent glycosyltransferase [Novosphingobium sp. ERN07]NLR72436.1 phospholipid carrier-dependent glycosyltransferase [Novosphingobium sp. ERN07]